MQLNHGFNHIIHLVAKATAIPITDGTHSWTWAFWIPVYVSLLVLLDNVWYVAYERRLPTQYRLAPGHTLEKKLGHRGFASELWSAWRILNDLPSAYWIIVVTQVSFFFGLSVSLADSRAL